jgi:hypothetical protein
MKIAPTCFGLRPSSGSLCGTWLKSHYILLGYVVLWQHVCNKKYFFKLCMWKNINSKYRTQINSVSVGKWLTLDFRMHGTAMKNTFDLIYQEIPTRCHVTVLYFLLCQFLHVSDTFRVHHQEISKIDCICNIWVRLIQDDGRPHDTVTVPDVACAVNLLISWWWTRNVSETCREWQSRK